MEIEEIDVFIETNGEVRIAVRGMKGAGCLNATRDLEAALGGGVVHREMTPDAAETDSEPSTERQSQSG